MNLQGRPSQQSKSPRAAVRKASQYLLVRMCHKKEITQKYAYEEASTEGLDNVTLVVALRI